MNIITALCLHSPTPVHDLRGSVSLVRVLQLRVVGVAAFVSVCAYALRAEK